MLNYLKSSISISSYNGCVIGCKYCILSVLGNRTKVEKVSDEEELVHKLLNFRLYTKDIPVSINNQTDPFLNSTIQSSVPDLILEISLLIFSFFNNSPSIFCLTTIRAWFPLPDTIPKAIPG